MQVYILRHGVAEDAASGQSDAGRRLTEKGKSKLRTILARAREAGVAPDVILTSPLARARETAVIAKEALGFGGELIETEVLVPFSTSVKVWEEIRSDYGDAAQILLVGHDPLFSDFVCFLTGAPAGRIILKKGALALVEVEGAAPAPRGTLIWLLTAKTAGT
jgi:phosphohistidine phosphatase